MAKRRRKAADEPQEDLGQEYKGMMVAFNKVYNSDDYRERRKKMDHWLELYEGKLWNEDELESTDSEVQINYIFSNVETLCPLLTDNKPKWSIRARAPVFQNLANIYSKALEYLWDVQKMDYKLYLVMKDALLWPLGLMKIYWNNAEDEVQFDVVDPRTFVIAPGYENLWDAPWCGVKTRKPISWVVMNYNDKAHLVKPDQEENDLTAQSDEELGLFAAEQQFTTVYEIWYRDQTIITEEVEKENKETGEKSKEKVSKQKYPNGRIVTFTKDTILGDRESPFEHGKPPYVAFYDHRVNHKFWGMGEPQQIEHLHVELNKQLQYAVQHSRLAQNPNFVFDANAGFPDEFQDEFYEGGHLWPASFVNGTPIVKVDVGQMDRSHIELIRILASGIEETGGQTDLTKGKASKKERQSASEVSILIESSYTRVRQKVRNLENSIEDTCYLATSLMQQNYVGSRYFNYQTGSDEGDGLNFQLINNSTDFFKQANTPKRIKIEANADTGQPAYEEPEQEHNVRKQEDREYQEAGNLIESTFGEKNRVYFPFQIKMDTNSTLPTDKQSLANLMLRLAEIQVTPNSIVDDVAVMDTLNLPNRQAIKYRKDQEKQQIIAAKSGQGAPQGQPGRPTPGPRPVPIGGQAPSAPPRDQVAAGQ